MFGLDAPTVVAYVLAAGALILVPGQDTVVVLTRGLRSPRVGVAAALGVATGVLGHATAAALGLAALFRAVPALARAVALLGAAYLCYLAVETLRDDEFAASEGAYDDGTLDTGSGVRAGYRRGLLTNAANPKVALFFLAFLPGFAGGPDATGAMLVLGVVYAVLGALYLGAVGALAGRAGRLLDDPRKRRGVRVVSASVLVVLAGVLVASVV
ncbi:LysE family translocator [Halorarum halophilum]|uniref:LysE family translocator n=1 Tax=Halorarum halophilum TaxID=2743090 RepID=A0A7D5GCG1_9EURY|nr:LysE family translocator [Halobaculum halophilum]QLG28192.1 LysE family translocator [Halobaculum halophilum]